jgi:hypothetical protein
LLDFQAPELTDQQIDRFALFVFPQELSIYRSLDLISTIPENNSGISIFAFRAVFQERDGRGKCSELPSYVPYKGTYVLYDGTYGASDQGQMLDV